MKTKYLLLFFTIHFLFLTKTFSKTLEISYPGDSLLTVVMRTSEDLWYFYGDSPQQYTIDKKQLGNARRVEIYVYSDFYKISSDYKRRFNSEVSPRDLEILNAKFKILFDKLRQLPLIRKMKIEIKSKAVKKLPDDLFDFNTSLYLRELEIEAHYLERLPTSLGTQVDLRKCRISCANIESFIHVEKLKELRFLDFYADKIKNINQDLSNLKSIEYLGLIIDSLETIPAEIGQLKTLKELSIWSEKLIELPREMGDLSSLEGIFCVVPKLEKIPREMTNLKMLKSCVIKSKEIKKWPRKIEHLPVLENFYIGSNGIE